MTPIETIAAALIVVGLDPDLEIYGIQHQPGEGPPFLAYCVNTHERRGETPRLAADLFAAEPIVSTTPWKAWTDDDDARHGFTRKWKGVRIRVIQGAVYDATEPGDEDQFDWNVRYYLHADSELTLAHKLDLPRMTIDQVQMGASSFGNKVIVGIQNQQKKALRSRAESQMATMRAAGQMPEGEH